MSVHERCRTLELILCDVDGVLTDGGIVYDDRGGESKTFHIRDGQGIKLWQKAGHRFGIITGRSSTIVERRARELGIAILRQGMERKWEGVRRIIEEMNLPADRVCYIGDDLPDVSAIRKVGFGVTVADACFEARREAHFVTTLPGGRGAVREVIEMILKEQGRWDELLKQFED